jgi:hypothetical protein
MLVLAAVSAGSFPSCSGEATPRSGSGVQSVPADQFPDAAAQAICLQLGGCCRAAGLVEDPARCKTVLSSLFSLALSFGGDAGAAYDARSSAACIQSAAVAASKCDFEQANLGTPACLELLGLSDHGRTGDACSWDCSSERGHLLCGGVSVQVGVDASVAKSCYTNDALFCDPSTGTCREQTGAGGRCSSSRECKNGGCRNGVCVSPLGAGESCGSNLQACAAGLFCELPSFAFEGQCNPLHPVGAPCTTDSACESESCTNDICDSTPGRSFLAAVCGS